jgi:hypothetical protein
LPPDAQRHFSHVPGPLRASILHFYGAPGGPLASDGDETRKLRCELALLAASGGQ